MYSKLLYTWVWLFLTQSDQFLIFAHAYHSYLLIFETYLNWPFLLQIINL